MIFFLALAVLIPTMKVEAAYILVPNFYNMTSNRIELRIDYIDMEHRKYKDVNYTRWYYQVMDEKRDKYVDKYIQACLARKYRLELVGESNNDWYFVYNGAQSQYIKKIDGKFHMHVGVSGNQVIVDLTSGMLPE